MTYPRVLPVGDAAVTLELGETIDAELAARVVDVDRALQAAALEGVRESVPTYRSLLVVYDRNQLEYGRIRERLLVLARASRARPHEGREIVIGVVYDGADLDEVAERSRMKREEVVERHVAPTYQVFMLGFSPGFAYMGELDPAIRVGRRATPRTRVPQGAVAIAGSQTGVYPRELPGGWNLIGRTGARLFAPASPSPFLLLPGDRVRFERREPADAAATEGVGDMPLDADDRSVRASLVILDTGFRASIQDEGRFGQRRFAVPWAGFGDRTLARKVNLAAGNDARHPLIELVGGGFRARAEAPLCISVGGFQVAASLHRADLGRWSLPEGPGPIRLRPGNELSIESFRGAACVAISGLLAPRCLGSASADEASGLLRYLREGDRLDTLGIATGPMSAATGEHTPRSSVGQIPAEICARVVIGPQATSFSAETIDRFLGSSWTVGRQSNRVGLRLDGPRIDHAGSGEIVSDGMVPGCIQVPPDGRPILMMRDCPTTGGYPKIATVVSDDLDSLAHVEPARTRVRFVAIRIDQL